MNEQTIRFRFGIFVLASMILLAVLTILFGGFPSFFQHTNTYTIIFTNAQGISPGTPIRRSGVKIGEVRGISLDNATGKVKVDIRVEDQFTLRKGDRPTLTQGLIGGDAAIAFIPPEEGKQADAPPVEPGSVLEGVSPADAASLLQKTGDLVPPAQDALNEIRKVFHRLDNMMPVLEEALKDFSEIGKLAKTSAPELKNTNEEIRALAKTTREMVPEIRRTNDEIALAARNWGKVGERVDVLLKTNEDKIVRSIELAEDNLRRLTQVLSNENIKYVNETLRNLRNGTMQLESISKDTGDFLKDSRVTVKQLNETLKRADDAFLEMQRAMKPLSDRGPSLFKNADESLDILNKTLKDMRDLVQIFARSDGTVQKLLTDPSLYNHLNDTAEMATKLMPRVDHILRDMETFADKLARHPELLGIKGALSPSNGLKGSPTLPYHAYP